MQILTPKIQESKKELKISEDAKKLFQLIHSEQEKKEVIDRDIPKIKVSDVVSKLAFYYEKIRNAIDYNEEHLLRKNAVRRILKRIVIIEGEADELGISKNLLEELIRAGYLPNNEIYETKIDEVAEVIAKYLKLRKATLSRIMSEKDLKYYDVVKAKKKIEIKNEMSQWIMAMAASEIDESFGRDKVKEAVVSNMYKILSDRIQLSEGLPYEKDLKIQVYLSVHRKFMHFDDEMLSYILFKYFNPNWNIITDAEIEYISNYIFRLKKAIKYQLEHPLLKQIDNIVVKYKAYYASLIKSIDKEPVDFFNKIKVDSKLAKQQIEKICNAKYAELKSKLWRAAIRSIIYIFLTKSILVFILEIPATKFLGEQVDPISLIINIAFPALLLFFIIIMTKRPDDEDTKKVIEGIKDIVFVDYGDRDVYTLRRPAKRGKVLSIIFGIIYFITYLVSFGAVVYILDKINFNWISIVIFVFFLALVSFFSVRIRKHLKEYSIVERKEGFVKFFVDFLAVPIIVVGKWLSEKFSRFNLFVFIFDFLLEAPFKIIVNIADDWTKYTKERKDEIM